MKKRFSLVLALMLSILFVLPLGCKKDTPDPQTTAPAKPEITYYSNTSGNPAHIGIVAKMTQQDTDQELFMYGGYDANGVPNGFTSAILQDNANGYDLNYIMNSNGKPAYSWFTRPDGSQDTILYYFNYFTDIDYVVTIYDHDWTTDANVMLYQADVKLVDGKPQITKTYSIAKQAAVVTFDPRDKAPSAYKVLFTLGDAVSFIGDATRTVIGIGALVGIGVVCPGCLAAGVAVGLLWPDDSNASEPDPSDLEDPSTANPPADPIDDSDIDPDTNPTTSTTTTANPTTSTPTTSTPTTSTPTTSTPTTSTPTTSTPTTSTPTTTGGPDTLGQRIVYPWR